MSDWRKDLLRKIGAKPTKQNLNFLATWQRWEGGHTNNSARFNWLNTTKDAPGAIGSINSVGVKKFKSYQYGIQALAQTLANGHYDDIVTGLRSGNPYQHDLSRGLQTWVAGPNGSNPGYVQKIMGGQTAASVPPVHERAKHAVGTVRARATAVPKNDAWGLAMRMIWDDDPEMAEIMSSLDDDLAVSSGLVSPRGSLRPVPADTAAPGKANSVAQVAGTQIGKPYVFGSGPGTDSFDCSDLIQWSYKQIGINIPRVTYDQIKIGRSVKGQKYQPGDLIFPHKGHVVMYVGNGKVIAAPYTGTVVQYQPVPSNPLEVRRVL